MKRVLRYAAEHGYDRVSWDTGETNAARYDLSKHIDELRVSRDGDNYIVRMRRGGRELGSQDGPVSKLPDIVGKELAEKIVNDKIGDGAQKTYSGLDLKVGGEGMRAFYDKILPAFVNKYAKKWGAKVEESSLPALRLHEPRVGEGDFPFRIVMSDGREFNATRTREAAEGELREAQQRDPGARIEVNEALLRERTQAVPVHHSVPITPAMRESVMRGQPMFKNARNATSGEPFSDFISRIGGTNRVLGTFPEGQIIGHFTPGFQQRAAAVAGDLRARLDRLGLGDVALRIADYLTETTTGAERHPFGAQWSKVIAVAIRNAERPLDTLNHEVIHALRTLNLIRPHEWNALSQEIPAWRQRFDIDKRYAGESDKVKDEEAVAEAFQHWAKTRSTKGIAARVFDRVRSVIRALGQALRGQGFTTAESVFRSIDTGKVGRRAGYTYDNGTVRQPMRSEPGKPTEEPGAVDAHGKPLPQLVIPGAERSARQAQAARETGTGRIAPKAPQKPAGRLFGAPEPQQNDLFGKPKFALSPPGGAPPSGTGLPLTGGSGRPLGERLTEWEDALHRVRTNNAADAIDAANYLGKAQSEISDPELRKRFYQHSEEGTPLNPAEQTLYDNRLFKFSAGPVAVALDLAIGLRPQYLRVRRWGARSCGTKFRNSDASGTEGRTRTRFLPGACTNPRRIGFTNCGWELR